MKLSPSAASDRSRKKAVTWVLLVLITLGTFLTLRAYGAVSIETLIQHEQDLGKLQAQRPIFLASLGMLLYVVLTGLSFPGAMALTMLFGWLFGFLQGLIMVSFASTAGATIAFLISRYFLRDFFQKRFRTYFDKINESVEKEGAYYLLSLRFLPVAPFFVVNTVMGLTPMRLRTYWWVSQLGMLPGTSIVVYTGTTIPDVATLNEHGISELISPHFILALTLLALFPLLARQLQAQFRSTASPPGQFD